MPIIFSLILFILTQKLVNAFDIKILETNFGKLKGNVLKFISADGRSRMVEQYLGVPYCQLPPHDKRFVMPQMVINWSRTGIKDATKFGPVCPQMMPAFWSEHYEDKAVLKREALDRMPEANFENMLNLASFLNDVSEDCLNLNLYVPERRAIGAASTSLPVLVLVHGESFDYGTGNAYNGSILAANGQIIVVTLNYRLGVLGFLSSGDSTCRGNWALADIACALQFLRSILLDFGGDPHWITLLGWEKGATLVNLLMTSPISAPASYRLFQRAILLGGSAYSGASVVENPGDYYKQLADGVGCRTHITDEDRREALMPQSVTTCIKSRPLNDIMHAAQRIEQPTFLMSFGPVVDGVFVSNEPTAILESHASLFKGLDLMLGLTENDAFGYLSQKDIESGIDMSKRDSMIRTLVRNLYDYHREEIFKAILREYASNNTNSTDSKLSSINVRNSLLNALSDALYAAPIVKLARIHGSKSQTRDEMQVQRQKKTFFFLFSHENRHINRGNVHGSIRGEELIYFLGYPLMVENRTNASTYKYLKFDHSDQVISETCMRYLANFVKCGDPKDNGRIELNIGNRTNVVNQIVWLPFETGNQEVFMRIDSEPGLESNYREQQMAFWNLLVPALQDIGLSGVNAEQNLLPDHFVNGSYFGIVRSWSTTRPVRPPPPPPPMPSEFLEKRKVIRIIKERGM